MATPLKFLTVPPKGNHTATVIFMHGLGDSGYGWKPVADQLSRDPSFQHIKWVLPNAPIVPCTANGGMSMPGWFDIPNFQFTGPEDETGILNSRNAVNDLIEQEINGGIPANKIVVGGFSQGGALTLVTGLTTPHKLAGLTVMSGWFAIRGKVKALLGQHATAVPIFWGHGVDDTLIPLQLGRLSKGELEKIGGKEAEESGEPGIFFKEYPGMGHSANPREINDWASWLKKVIPS